MPRQRKRPAGPHRLRAGRQPARDRGEHERLDEHAKIRPLPRSDPAVEAEVESYRRAEAAQVHLLEYSLAVHPAREPQRLVAKLPGTPPTRANRPPEVERIGRRSAERREGKACVSTWRSRGSPTT